MKYCSRCKLDKSESAFPLRRGKLYSWCRECTAAYRRFWKRTVKGRKTNGKCDRHWEKKSGRKRIWDRVYKAVKSGCLIRTPCEKCGDPKVQAHHDDYNKPLNVRWLCQTCHSAEHGVELVGG